MTMILDCIKQNTFIPFPDRCFHNGDGSDPLLSLIDQKKNISYTTWEYCGSDDVERFESNLKKTKKDWYYRNNPIKYTLNSLGYRTKNFDEIDWENSIVIFGCSYVQGVGVDDRHTLSHLLEKELNLPVVNMGVSGSSNIFHLYNISVLLTQYPKPKAILHFPSSLQRYPVYHWDYVNFHGEWTDDKTKMKNNRPNIVVQNTMALNIINNMCQSRTTYIEYCVEHPLYKFLEEFNPNQNRIYIDGCEPKKNIEEDYARDLAHYGVTINKRLSKSLAEILKNRLV
jgi:hypothetical protein